MTRNIKSKRWACRRGFTLIETLVVVMIILVLVGLLLPALMFGREQSRKRKAKSEARDLAKAWDSYLDAYTNWPYGGDILMDDGSVAVLSGLDVGKNPNTVKLMDFTRNQQLYGFKDPWGRLYKAEWKGNQITRERAYRMRAYMGNKKRYEDN